MEGILALPNAHSWVRLHTLMYDVLISHRPIWSVSQLQHCCSDVCPKFEFPHAYMNQSLIRTLRIIVSVVPLFSILLFLDSLFSSLSRSWRVRKKYHCEADENLAQRWLHTWV